MCWFYGFKLHIIINDKRAILNFAITLANVDDREHIFSKTQFPPISTETTTENQDIQLAYGLGWGLMQTPYGRAFFKEGGDDAWKNYNVNFIDQGISFILITNSVNGSTLFKELLAKLIGDHFTPWKWEQYFPIGYQTK